MERPETRYAKSGEIYIAYQVVGDGPLNVVLLPNWFSNVELMWDYPPMERYLSRLAGFSSLLIFDQRGTGLSDPVALTELVPLEERAADILAVMDAARMDRAVIFGVALTSPLALFFAASHGERTHSLVLSNGWARKLEAPDYPIGEPHRDVEADRQQVLDFWPTTELWKDMPSQRDRAQDEWLAYYRRMSIGPGAAAAMITASYLMDVRSLLGAVHVPTLVMHNEEGWTDFAHGEYLAEHIEGAKLVRLPGRDENWADTSAYAALDEVQEFLTGERRAYEADRMLATVLFTDIVGSTERVAEIGDRAWRDSIGSHDSTVRRTLDRFGGRLVDRTGDGALATFDGPARAIRCAKELHAEVSKIGLDIRAGLHTGEVEVAGNDIRGIAVHIGARVAALAAGGETLVSSTVKDLVVGSGIAFEDRGLHTLKGVPDEWRIFAVKN